jgi:hypothetical protein
MPVMYCDGCYTTVTTTNNNDCPVCLTDFFLHEPTELDKEQADTWAYEIYSDQDN